MNAADELKNFLRENNWLIGDEDLAEENKIVYEIILAVKNLSQVAKVTKKETSPLLKKYFTQKLEKLEKVESEMKKSSSAIQTEKFFNLQQKISELKMKINTITF